MKIFISSLIGGFEQYRTAAVTAVETLHHRALRAEGFSASPETAQQACLAAVRDSDVVILLLGASYGTPQESGLSATHEEYREARDTKPVFVFVEADISAEPAQQVFLAEVEAWATGHVRVTFSTREELEHEIIRALHDYELATAIGAVDESEMLERAAALAPAQSGFAATPQLLIAIAGGPRQQVLRPAQLEDPELIRDIQRETLFGSHPVLDSGVGTDVTIEGANLHLRQQSGSVTVDQAGSLCIIQPTQHATTPRMAELSALIEEDIGEILARGLRFGGWLLDRIDPVHRLSDVVALVRLQGVGYMPWRTRAQHSASPNSGGVRLDANDPTVHLTPASRHRQALMHDVDRMVEDLLVLLRREVQP